MPTMSVEIKGLLQLLFGGPRFKCRQYLLRSEGLYSELPAISYQIRKTPLQLLGKEINVCSFLDAV